VYMYTAEQPSGVTAGVTDSATSAAAPTATAPSQPSNELIVKRLTQPRPCGTTTREGNRHSNFVILVTQFTVWMAKQS
jgi:hypothetical protein